MKFSRAVFLTGILFACSNLVHAEDQGLYAGVNLGVGRLDLNTPNGSDKKSQAVAGVLLGYKFNRNFAVETEFTGAGKVDDNVRGSVKADALSVSALGILPVTDNFDFYGKLGVADVKTKVSSIANMQDKNHAGITYGVGGEYRFSKEMGLRLEANHYKGEVDSLNSTKSADSNVVSVGLTYHF